MLSNQPGKSTVLCCTVPHGQDPDTPFPNRASVDGTHLDSESTLSRTVLLILVSHLLWWSYVDVPRF